MKKNIFIFIFALFLGWYLHLNHEDEFHYWGVKYRFVEEKSSIIKDSRQENPEEISCSSISRDNLMVVLTAGQSNAANSGETKYTPRGNIYNFYKGKCYIAKDPLLGAVGSDGSVWTRFGEKALLSGYSSVIIAPIAVGGTRIKSWADRNKLGKRILETSKSLNDKGFKITHNFWHQGERDAEDDYLNVDTYKDNLLKVISLIRESSEAPIYIAQVSRCYKNKGIPALRSAQKSVVNNEDILAGPNTDDIGRAYRWDGCHLSTEGLNMAADMWLKSTLN